MNIVKFPAIALIVLLLATLVAPAAYAVHRGGFCVLDHSFMQPSTDIQPDPLLVLSAPANVEVTVTFNRAVADTVVAHGLQFMSLTGPSGLNTPATSFGAVTNGDRTVVIRFSGAAVAAALNQHLMNLGLQQGPVTLTVHGHWFSQPHLFDVDENVCPEHAEGSDTIQAIKVIPVDTDIKPGSDPNSINPNSKGKIPVAILSTEDFDATTEVDRESLTFGRTGDEDSLAKCTKSTEDVNGDGLDDLVCHFNTQDTGFEQGNTEGILKGLTNDGIPIEGSDSVRIVPK